MTLPELLDKHGILHRHMAERIGMNRTTFTNKLRGRLNCYFAPEEFEKIKAVLEEIGIDMIKFVNQ